MTKNICDRNGTPVKIRTKVRLLSFPEWLLSKEPKDESERLESMIGEVFQVCDIDKWGGVWVEKWFNKKDHISYNHSISLDSHEMEVID
jgi:hypothetical protein